ncbi:hypothetical protein M0722_01595 [Microbacterium sp. KSW4-16]|uniref:hypothetical protein n=1 Tax=Microbacterium aurugineum TaxID=2851642 RepID=UPI0020C00E2E|nr:hypothetical protein [Microbacterium aurugineum]MCK8465876.1 hypothetical protein [Microbacterium aurugineum]
MIPDAVALAILALAGVVLAALIAGGITLAVNLTKWQVQNQRLWFWNRQLVDHIYRGSPPPPPPPPGDLFD